MESRLRYCSNCDTDKSEVLFYKDKEYEFTSFCKACINSRLVARYEQTKLDKEYDENTNHLK
jgi:hypothetical protein